MKENFVHMFEKPYIRKVLQELNTMGYESEMAKKVLVRFYKNARRLWGFRLQPREFACEIDEVYKAVTRKFDPNDPDHIYVGHLRGQVSVREFVKSFNRK
ncbi:hypothetical protein [Paenibacillus sp. LPE1-1-1.1]|uniref:hypothetical protein n=1 Tax=Paenibacillus sp. LPE1-1-1.1 TaxID=3135230 RepID=UPI00341FF5BE